MTTYRDARTGEFVTADHAEANPDTTVAEDNTRVRELAAERDALLARLAEANPDTTERDRLRALIDEVRAYCRDVLDDPTPVAAPTERIAFDAGRDAVAEHVLELIDDEGAPRA